MNGDSISISQFQQLLGDNTPYEGYVDGLGYASWSYVDFFRGTFSQVVDVRPEARRIQMELQKKREEEKKKNNKQTETPWTKLEAKRDAVNVYFDERKREIEVEFLEYQRILKSLAEKAARSLSIKINAVKEAMTEKSNVVSSIGLAASAFERANEKSIKTARHFYLRENVSASMVKNPISGRYIEGWKIERMMKYANRLGRIMGIVSFAVIGLDVYNNEGKVKTNHLVQAIAAAVGLGVAIWAAPVWGVAVGVLFISAEIYAAISSNGQYSAADLVVNNFWEDKVFFDFNDIRK